MPTFSSHDDAVLYYELRGPDGASPVVVLGGGPARHPDYLGDLGALDTVRTLLFLHQRGVGRSSVGAIQLAAWPALAKDVEALRLHLGFETLDVLAHSAGTRVALAWAADHPERVGRLCLVTPPAGWLVDVANDSDALLEGRQDEDWYEAYRDVQPTLASITDYADFLPFAHLTAPAAWAVWDDRARTHEELGGYDREARIAFFSADPDRDLVAELGAVTAPVLVVAGERDAAVGVRPVLAVAELFPHGTGVLIPDAGHYPWVEQPELFYDAVAAFLHDE